MTVPPIPIEPDPILFAGGGTNLYAYAGENPVNFVDLTGLYSYSLFQLAAIVYNETASLSGSGINAARLDIAYVALNRPQPGGVAPDKFTPSAISAIVGRDPPALAAYISSWMAAWCASSYPQYDPTHGAQYFNLRPDKSSKPFEGEPLLIQNGPFNNSVPSKLLPSSGIYVNVYGRP